MRPNFQRLSAREITLADSRYASVLWLMLIIPSTWTRTLASQLAHLGDFHVQRLLVRRSFLKVEFQQTANVSIFGPTIFAVWERDEIATFRCIRCITTSIACYYVMDMLTYTYCRWIPAFYSIPKASTLWAISWDPGARFYHQHLIVIIFVRRILISIDTCFASTFADTWYTIFDQSVALIIMFFFCLSFDVLNASRAMIVILLWARSLGVLQNPCTNCNSNPGQVMHATIFSKEPWLLYRKFYYIESLLWFNRYNVKSRINVTIWEYLHCCLASTRQVIARSRGMS